MRQKQKILILDFGSQTTALIGRRIREAGVYSEIIPGDSDLSGEISGGVKGIILSGSPESVYADGPVPDSLIYTSGLPLLGICYGAQRMTADLGGKVGPLPKREYGRIEVDMSAAVLTLSGGETFTSWMSHGDTITQAAENFIVAGRSRNGFPAVIVHKTNPWFGLQFHPEVTHCGHGFEILKSFALEVCKAEQNWTMEGFIEEEGEKIRKTVRDLPALLLISGGVDSTVVAALLLKTLPDEQVHLLYVDTGLMRKNETESVRENLLKLGAKNLRVVRCEEQFLDVLRGLEAPEAKRKAIGDLFIKIQEREVRQLNLKKEYFLVQGTLYTDLIESGKGVGKRAHIIKSHHNVGSPLVEEKRAAGRLLEPLDRLYKDEVRSLGRILKVDEAVIRRHPFPGPGLAVRILGEVTKEKCDILREADAVFIEELKKRVNPENGKTLYDDIWQAFAVLLPVRSVGVAGDVRKYGYVLALRAVTSADGMTADVYPFALKDLIEISTLITNSVPGIGRVSYDISSKPPATIEWE